MLSALHVRPQPLDIAKFFSIPKGPVYDTRNRYLANGGAKGSKKNPIGKVTQIIVTPEKTSPR